jgi:hypothetical protein
MLDVGAGLFYFLLRFNLVCAVSVGFSIGLR